MRNSYQENQRVLLTLKGRKLVPGATPSTKASNATTATAERENRLFRTPKNAVACGVAALSPTPSKKCDRHGMSAAGQNGAKQLSAAVLTYARSRMNAFSISGRTLYR